MVLTQEVCHGTQGSPCGQHRQIVEIPFRHTGVRHHLALLAKKRNNPSKPRGTVLFPWPLKLALLARLAPQSTTVQFYACQNQSGNSSFSIQNSGIHMSLYRTQGSYVCIQNSGIIFLYTKRRDPCVCILDSGIHVSMCSTQGSICLYTGLRDP